MSSSASYGNRSNSSVKVSSFLSSKSTEEQIENEAQIYLKDRENEIERLNLEIQKAGKELSSIRAQICLKIREYDTELTGKEEEETDENMIGKSLLTRRNYQELEEIEKNNNQEIEQIQKDFKEEIEELKLEYIKRLETSEKWANEHIQSIIHQKELELITLEEELNNIQALNKDQIKRSTDNYSMYLNKTNNLLEQNQNRIETLQEEISNLTSNSRDQVRDIRHKISEALNTLEIRKNEHLNDIKLYENEFKHREENYKIRLETLTNQFSAELETIENSINKINIQIRNETDLQKKLNNFFQRQINITNNDNERLRQTLLRSKEREHVRLKQNLEFTNQVRNYRKICNDLEEQDRIILDEIEALKVENEELAQDLARLDKKLYGRE